MTPLEIGAVLGLAAARDRRTIGDADILAWMEDLDGISFDEARQAVSRHYRTSTEWLTAAHIRANVRLIRDDQRRTARRDQRALETYSKYNPRPGQADRNRAGHELCTETITEMRTA